MYKNGCIASRRYRKFNIMHVAPKRHTFILLAIRILHILCGLQYERRLQ